MGLKKRDEFDHSRQSVFEAAGYSEKTVTEELEPRAMLLANQLVHAALTDPLRAIEVLLDSPVLEDSGLDGRDRAIIVVMAGRFLARAAIQQLSAPYGPAEGNEYAILPGAVNPGAPGRVRSIHIGRVEWDTLVHHVEHKVFGRSRKESEHIESIQEVLDDEGLSPVQKAVVEVLVMKKWATETGGEWDISLREVMAD